MILPAPPVGAIELIFDKLDEVALELASHDKLFAAGVASIGEAAGYALVWEWGNVRQAQAGDETCQGVNPDGSTVWLSVQAPFGYISINEPLYWAIVEDVLADVKFMQTNAADMTAEFERAMSKIAKQIAPIIKAAAPKDSGALRDSIVAVDPGDSILDDDDAEIGAFVGSTEGRWQP
jgi:hypothetical protein